MSTCCDPTCGQSINVKSARHMHQNRGRPAPKPRATHPNSAQAPSSPIQTLCKPPAPEPRAAHPNCASPQLRSCVPAIQNHRMPPILPPIQTPRARSCAACQPPKTAGPQLLSRVPPTQHPNSAGPQLQSRVPPSQTPRAPSSRAACHPPARRVPFSSEERTPTVPVWGKIKIIQV